MKTLRLTLTKKWFDMILSGEKTEEYREIKMYWCSRIPTTTKCLYRYNRESLAATSHYNPRCEKFIECVCLRKVYEEEINLVEFRNGYSKDAPTMLVESKGITTGIGDPLWGAPPHPVFIIKLGKVIETKNLK